MTSEQVRIALTANAVTRSTRTGFDFEDPCGKTLDEFTKGATLQCLRVAQQMQQPGFEKVLVPRFSRATPSPTGTRPRSSTISARIFWNC
jgi:hypothetical protein